MKESSKAIGKVQFNNVLKGKIVNVHYRNDNSLGLVLTGHESRRDLSNIFNKRLTMSIELQNGSKFVTALSILEIYNKELYKELGYSNLYDYTSDVFGMGKTNTNDYISKVI